MCVHLFEMIPLQYFVKAVTVIAPYCAVYVDLLYYRTQKSVERSA